MTTEKEQEKKLPEVIRTVYGNVTTLFVGAYLGATIVLAVLAVAYFVSKRKGSGNDASH